MALHKEWFPIDYPDDYFLSMERRKIIAIGCFYRDTEQEILLGSILSKLHGENDRTEPVFADLDTHKDP